MQTFLPSPDFAESARVLDRARLGKQRVETLQIAKALTTGSGWVNHPVVKMWVGYEAALAAYQIAVCDEWVKVRGYNDTCLLKTIEMLNGKITLADLFNPEQFDKRPPWLGDEALHASHRSNLLRKAPEHYRQFWPDDPDDLPYVWPV
jgi:hypothetical protein